MAHNAIVGKNILEMLMFSLYPEAETIYREYLQNACDSINEAVETNLLEKQEDGHVTINIDSYHQKVTISDNGTGIAANDAKSRLKDIATGYKKHKESAAGFYGIGRLVGAGYCKQLSFKTSAFGENVASEIVFDVDKIREILNDDENNLSASEVIDAVTTLTTMPQSESEHYFIVTLTDILPEYQEELLCEDRIYKYLVQVAPIPFLPEFKNNLITPNITNEKEVLLSYYKQLNSIQVSVNNSVNIRKPYGLTIDGTGEEIAKLRFFTLTDPQYGDLAWGWYAITPFEKAIPDIDPYNGNTHVLTRGIRLRVHNIQIGNENFFDGTSYFRQARSNKYFNGEIHVVNPKIKPTTDRSDLAPSKEALKLKDLIADFFNSELQKVYQTANKVKKELERIVEAETTLVPEKSDVSTDFPEKSKATQLSENIKKRTEAESEFDKYQSKKENESEGMKAMLDVYQQKLDKFKKDVSEGKMKPKKKEDTPSRRIPKPSIDEDIATLVPKYGEEKIDMLKRIFQIIDARYKSSKYYEKVIKGMKSSVVNDLKN